MLCKYINTTTAMKTNSATMKIKNGLFHEWLVNIFTTLFFASFLIYFTPYKKVKPQNCSFKDKTVI